MNNIALLNIVPLFHYNSDEKKKWFLAKATVSMEFAPSSMFSWVFSGFPPSSQWCACQVSWLVYMIQSERVWEGASGPVMEGHSVKGGCPLCVLSCWERLQTPGTLNWKKWVGNEFSYLFLFIFLKCINILHLFQCVILEVSWVFI